VESVAFSPSLEEVILSARLDDNAATLAREGTQFWVVKVEFGLAAIRNLGTIVTGDYIAIRPTEEGGESTYEFEGLRKPPVEEPAQWGLTIVLVNDNRGSISVGNKVFYRDIVVGEVTSYELAETGDHVRIYLNIQQRYAPLVREHSVFWNASGVDVNFGLFSGLEINTESFEAILAGGIAFATPDNADMGEQAKQHAVYSLQPKGEDEWRLWKPRIELGE
jgi:paraquat-inducible protein B